MHAIAGRTTRPVSRFRLAVLARLPEAGTNRLRKRANVMNPEQTDPPELEAGAALRELAVLEAWLNNEELPQGTLDRELPWLREVLWDAVAARRAKPAREVWKTFREQALGMVGGATGPTYRRALRPQGMSLAGDDEEDPHALPGGHLWGLTNSGKAVKIDCPFENAAEVTFPFGLALVEIEWPQSPRIGRALLPVERDERRGRFRGWATLRDLFPECSTSQLSSGTLYLTPVSFEREVLFRVDRGQLTYLRTNAPSNENLKQLERRRRELDAVLNPEECA